MSHPYSWKEYGAYIGWYGSCLLRWRIFCSSPQRYKAEILIAKIRERDGAFGRCLKHENRILTRGHEELAFPFPTGVTWPSVKGSLCQELNLLEP